MKQTVLFLSIGIASGLMLVNIYTSLVDAKSWGSDIPNSIVTAREYFKVVNPGDFFRIFSPVNQVLAILVVVLFWKSNPSLRLYLGTAALLFVLCDALTFGYFYPRNDIMFNSAALTDTALLKKTWSEWTSMNWVRTFMLFAGLVCGFYSLNKSYSGKSVNSKTQERETIEHVHLRNSY
jgi:hypothetical protein